jgi:hypothetical protein
MTNKNNLEKKSLFPVNSTTGIINGPLEFAALTAGGISGAYIGFQLGPDFVTYGIRELVDNQVANQFINFYRNNPLKTECVTGFLGAGAIGKPSQIIGSLTDRIFGTYHKE